MDTFTDAREVFQRHEARYEVAQYFELLDVRPAGIPPNPRRILAGFDVDLYGKGSHHGVPLSFENGDLRGTLDELRAACEEIARQSANGCRIEVIPLRQTLVLDSRNHLEPESMVRIRISRSGALGEPAGADEEKGRDGVVHKLDSLGVKRN